MKKKFARLTEQELHKIVNESLNRMLMERKAWVNPYQQYMQNYGDNGFSNFYDSDDDSQYWKTDVWRLNEMLKDMQNYCPSAASSIRRAISQIYKTMGTGSLQQSQPQQQQGWTQTYTQPNMSANYTQNPTRPNVNANYVQNSTMPQYQQQQQPQAQQQAKPVRNRRKRQPVRKKPQQPVQQQQQWMQNPYANSQITSTLNYYPNYQ